ncbi:MAG: ribonuclease P protein component [Crocinitomicaceae bacterium]
MPNNVNSLTFPKAEKLCSKRIIEQIYERGKKIKSYPFILNYLEVGPDFEMAFPVQIATAVPKRRVKLAVKRNRLKRQIREAYRLHKSGMIEDVVAEDKRLALFLLYIGKEPESYHFIEKKLILLLDSLRVQLKQKTNED